MSENLECLEKDWHYDIDPYGLLAIGDTIDNGTTKIIGFCAPAGIKPDHFMVKVEYADGNKTTRKYKDALAQKYPQWTI